MKNLRGIIFLSFVMLPLLGHAQQVAYEYDASGNRINRHRVIGSRRAMGSDNTQLFSVAPNPVSDVLQIKYEGETDFSGEYQYTLLGIYGETALTGKSTSANCSVDVSSLSQGVYILHILYKEEDQSIKIIKN